MENKGIASLMAGHWEYLGFGFSLLSFSCFSGQLSVVDVNYVPTVLVFLAGSVLGGLSTYLLAKSNKVGKKRLVVAIASLAMGCVGGVVFLYALRPSLTIVGMGLLGFGATMLWSAWTITMAHLNERHIIGYVLFSCALGSILASMLSSFGIDGVISGLVLLVVGGLLLPKAKVTDEAIFHDGVPDILGLQSSATGLRETALLLLLLVVLLFSLNFVSLTVFRVSDEGPQLRLVVGMAVVFLFMLLFVLTEKIDLLSVSRVAFPLSLAGLLLVEIVPADLSAVLLVLWIVPLGLVGAFAGIALIRLAGRAQRLNEIAVLVVISCVVAECLALVVARVVNRVSGEVTLELIQCCVVLVLVVLLVTVILPFGTRGSAAASEVPPEDDELRLEQFATSFGLTAREKDVLYLLVPGTTEAEIADTLFVGKGTVHSHVLHIYKKTDVHTRAELLEKLAGFKQ